MTAAVARVSVVMGVGKATSISIRPSRSLTVPRVPTVSGVPAVPVGLMLGDATGIGPEVAVKALASSSPASNALVVFGDVRVLGLGMSDAAVRSPYTVYPSLDAVPAAPASVPVIDLANMDRAVLTRGQISAESGRVCADTLKLMIDLALAGRL